MSSACSCLDKHFEVRYESLFAAGRALAFPCDEAGHVDLNALPPAALHNYLFVRAMVGRDYSVPRIIAT